MIFSKMAQIDRHKYRNKTYICAVLSPRNISGSGRSAKYPYKWDFIFTNYVEKRYSAATRVFIFRISRKRGGGQLAVRNGDWKGVKLDLKKTPKAHGQLFNLKNDPREQIDLAGDYPEILTQLDQIVKNQH